MLSHKKWTAKSEFSFLNFLVIGILFTGCQSSHEVDTRMITMPEVTGDFTIPSRIWDEILGIEVKKNSKDEHGSSGGGEHSSGGGGEHGGGDEHGSGGGSKKSAEPLISFNEIKVVLTEKNPNVLNEKSYTIQFPRGGGFLDLAKYVSNQNGSFYIHFQLPGDDKADQIKAFFVSKAKKRRLDGEVWGSGCKSAVEISSFYKKAISSGKFEVNTTRDRHLSLIGGHFIVSVNDGKQIKVTQVTIYDSRRADLMCDSFSVQ